MTTAYDAVAHMNMCCSGAKWLKTQPDAARTDAMSAMATLVRKRISFTDINRRN